MAKSLDVFKRSFEPIEGGYLYYPTRWSGGYFLSAAEYDALIADWERTAGFKRMLLLVGIALLGIVVSTVVSSTTDLDLDGIAPRAIAFGLAGYLIWKSTAVNRLVRGRKPMRPPRSGLEAEVAMGNALGMPLAIGLVVVSLSFVASGILLAQVEPFLGVPVAAIFAVSAILNARMVFRTLRSKW